MYNEDEIRNANKTARGAGAIGPNARVPRFILETRGETPLDRVLDFGAGPNAFHTVALRQEGMTVTAWEFGQNFNPEVHNPNALREKYENVMLSNVLNVQSSIDMLRKTVAQAAACVSKRGRLVANFPKSPRKCEDIGTDDIIAILNYHFNFVAEVEPGLFEAYNLWNPMRMLRGEINIFHCKGYFSKRTPGA